MCGLGIALKAITINGSCKIYRFDHFNAGSGLVGAKVTLKISVYLGRYEVFYKKLTVTFGNCLNEALGLSFIHKLCIPYKELL